jgi:hypothetical protein
MSESTTASSSSSSCTRVLDANFDLTPDAYVFRHTHIIENCTFSMYFCNRTMKKKVAQVFSCKQISHAEEHSILFLIVYSARIYAALATNIQFDQSIGSCSIAPTTATTTECCERYQYYHEQYQWFLNYMVR